MRAITRRRGAMHTSILTRKATSRGWIWRAKAHICDVAAKRCRTCKRCAQRSHALLNVFISMKKMSEGDPGRAAAAAAYLGLGQECFVFDEDIDVYNPTEILWALATRVQPHRQISIIPEIMRGSLIDPSMIDPRKTSVMIVDATKPLDRPFSTGIQMSRYALARISLEEFVPGEVLQHIPIDRTTYWA